MNEGFEKSLLVVLPKEMPHWEVSKVFDDFFNNTEDAIPECTRKLHAIIRDNPDKAHVYLGLLESRKRVIISTLLSNGDLKRSDDDEEDETKHSVARY